MNNNIDFNINNFNGPLDLLLDLVRDKKVDLKDINLIELADRYLEIINNLQDKDIDLASEYLVMAATLLRIKAAMILHPLELPEEVEEDKKRLLQRMAEYQQFKEVIEDLKIKEANRKHIFIKSMSSYDGFEVKRDESILDGHSSSIQIAIVLRKMFERNFAIKLRQTKFENFNLTPSDQIKYIRELFSQKGELTFEDIFTLPSLSHFVITLLALLDMSRRQEIILRQDEQYERIFITKGEMYDQVQ